MRSNRIRAQYNNSLFHEAKRKTKRFLKNTENTNRGKVKMPRLGENSTENEGKFMEDETNREKFAFGWKLEQKKQMED